MLHHFRDVQYFPFDENLTSSSSPPPPPSSFPFVALYLMLPEAPQLYGLLYYPRIGYYNFLHQFRAATPPMKRNPEL
jgi:hypothetical protein